MQRLASVQEWSSGVFLPVQLQTTWVKVHLLVLLDADVVAVTITTPASVARVMSGVPFQIGKQLS